MNTEIAPSEVSEPIEIPEKELSAEALSGIIDNFILREGTDYGATEKSYESKVDSIKRQLEARLIKIVFDPQTDSISIVPALPKSTRP
jgi:uncharacterized protein YheU (UPF0270 family)